VVADLASGAEDAIDSSSSADASHKGEGFADAVDAISSPSQAGVPPA